jgi:hypothetical protein
LTRTGVHARIKSDGLLCSKSHVEPDALQNVVMQQLEYDDMAGEHSSDKSAATERKPSRRSPAPQQPEIRPPLLTDGQESVRDSNC